MCFVVFVYVYLCMCVCVCVCVCFLWFRYNKTCRNLIEIKEKRGWRKKVASKIINQYIDNFPLSFLFKTRSSINSCDAFMPLFKPFSEILKSSAWFSLLWWLISKSRRSSSSYLLIDRHYPKPFSMVVEQFKDFYLTSQSV